MAFFREDLPAIGHKFQFITLAGSHALNTAIFKLASACEESEMAGYSILQEREFAL
jgi:isocitrate lyase